MHNKRIAQGGPVCRIARLKPQMPHQRAVSALRSGLAEPLVGEVWIAPQPLRVRQAMLLGRLQLQAHTTPALPLPRSRARSFAVVRLDVCRRHEITARATDSAADREATLSTKATKQDARCFSPGDATDPGGNRKKRLTYDVRSLPDRTCAGIYSMAGIFSALRNTILSGWARERRVE